MVRFLLIWGLFFVLACSPDINRETPGANVTDQRFFDLSNYFKAEQQRLHQLQSSFTKKAVVNGQEEVKILRDLDFEKELAMFIDSDINKVAWLDKYEVDSTFTDDQLIRISYKTTDQSLKTQGLIINFDSGQVDKIDIIRRSTSIAANIKQELTYEPNSGYAIKSVQNTKLSDPEIIELVVTF